MATTTVRKGKKVGFKIARGYAVGTVIGTAGDRVDIRTAAGKTVTRSRANLMDPEAARPGRGAAAAPLRLITDDGDDEDKAARLARESRKAAPAPAPAAREEE